MFMLHRTQARFSWRRAGDERLERPLRLHLLSPAVRVQPVWRPRTLCSRAGNVHSRDGWDDVLKPVVARYQGKVSRIYFRADAAFAMPEVYEFLEAERIKYAIRLPANQPATYRCKRRPERGSVYA